MLDDSFMSFSSAFTKVVSAFVSCCYLPSWIPANTNNRICLSHVPSMRNLSDPKTTTGLCRFDYILFMISRDNTHDFRTTCGWHPRYCRLSGFNTLDNMYCLRSSANTKPFFFFEWANTNLIMWHPYGKLSRIIGEF